MQTRFTRSHHFGMPVSGRQKKTVSHCHIGRF
jgi:hypothetical protein